MSSSAQAAAQSHRDIRLAIRGDIDGKGTQHITLRRDGTLAIGSKQTAILLDDADDVFWDHAVMTVVELGKGRRGLLIGTPTEGSEDPPNRYRVYIVDGGAIRPVFDRVIGVYGVTALDFRKDGTMRYRETGWMACDGMPATATAPLHDIVFVYDAAKKKLVEKRKDATGLTYNCNELAACPFVYVGGERVGEILRDVRGRAAATTQPLALPMPVERGRLVVRISEDKPEVTFLDELYLEVDGERVAPVAWRPVVLRRGDAIDVTFEIMRGGAAALVARGYYDPAPTRSR